MKKILFTMVFIIFGLVGCATSTIKVFVPSPIVLREYGTIGIIDFTSNTDPSINRYATQIFQEYVQAAQPGVPFLELGTRRDVLSAIGANQLNAQAIAKIGEVYKVDAIFIGDLVYSNVKTDFDISQALDLKASMKTYIVATLVAKLNLVRNGATVWSNSSSFKRTLSKLRVGKESSLSLDIHYQDAQRKLLPDMVHEITCDFRGRYVRQKAHN